MSIDGHNYLKTIADRSKIAIQNTSDRTTIKELLRRYGYSNRTKYIKKKIQGDLDKLGLCTVPSFRKGPLSTEITISLHHTD